MGAWQDFLARERAASDAVSEAARLANIIRSAEELEARAAGTTSPDGKMDFIRAAEYWVDAGDVKRAAAALALAEAEHAEVVAAAGEMRAMLSTKSVDVADILAAAVVAVEDR